MIKKRKLIYDVGLHKGKDTAYYLKKGFDVIAFEADPEFVEMCEGKFKKDILSGRLIIVQGAIVDKEKVKSDVISFYKNNEISVWGTALEETAIRNEKLGTTSTKITVETIDFKECLEKYGIPYYLKIDIEGMDAVCLEALKHFDKKPDYISIESEKQNFENLESEFDFFEELGYNNYKIINQSDITKSKEPKTSKEGVFVNHTFEFGSSGLFGRDTSSSWLDRSTALNRYKWIYKGYQLFGDQSNYKGLLAVRILKRGIQKLTGSSLPGWYDTHARHSSVSE